MVCGEPKKEFMALINVKNKAYNRLQTGTAKPSEKGSRHGKGKLDQKEGEAAKKDGWMRWGCIRNL